MKSKRHHRRFFLGGCGTSPSLRMVSRFTNGSPIQVENVPETRRYLLAEFNRDVTPSELHDKLKAVIYTEGYGAEVETAFYSDGCFFLIGNCFINLEVEGNKLYATNAADAGYIFGLYFDGQHRKVL